MLKMVLTRFIEKKSFCAKHFILGVKLLPSLKVSFSHFLSEHKYSYKFKDKNLRMQKIQCTFGILNLKQPLPLQTIFCPEITSL